VGSFAFALAAALGLTHPNRAQAAFLDAAEQACSDTVCEAELITFAWYESGIDAQPKPWSHDAKDGTSCGYLQEPCAFVRAHSVLDQAREWVRLRDASLAACGDGPEGLAALASGSCDRGRRLSAYRREVAQSVLYGATWTVYASTAGMRP
jgi:hypothetical protein